MGHGKCSDFAVAMGCATKELDDGVRNLRGGEGKQSEYGGDEGWRSLLVVPRTGTVLYYFALLVVEVKKDGVV